ncbi:ABC transporter permease subunit [Spirillospora sp. NPDC029432]|uniref:ABC transporter permease subunit n=1 Tax=Spirillospora sp. NPDC029432 TaxID=3154599 RepID=UPI0034534653
MMLDAVAAEWLKLRTVRSTYIIAGVAVVFAILALLLTVQVVSVWDGMPAERRARVRMAEPAILAGWIAGLCAAVLGAVAVTSEYRSGMIRTTLTVMQRRAPLLAAKAIVVGGAALAAGLMITFSVFLGTRLIIGDRPITGFQTAISAELPGIAARGCLVGVYALLAFGLAALLRSTAGAIVTVVLLWYIVPIATGFLPAPWDERLSSFTLDALPEQAVGMDNADSVYGAVLPPPAAAAVMLAYALLPPAAAMLAFRRRDA